MIRPDAPIGVMDSGVGGLTVVRSLRKLLPNEKILFCGDSANCPYGNRSEDEVFELGMAMVHSLEQRGVKCIVIACNTMSAVVDRMRSASELEFFSIVESAAKYVTGMGLDSAGLIATRTAVNSGIFDRCLKAIDPGFRLTAQGSHELAAMIDRGFIEGEEVEAEIRKCVGQILERDDIHNLILGCTHYPIAIESFRRCYPELSLIDAAHAQAETVVAWLRENELLNGGTDGGLTIRTSGGPTVFERVCRQLDIADKLEIVTVDKM